MSPHCLSGVDGCVDCLRGNGSQTGTFLFFILPVLEGVDGRRNNESQIGSFLSAILPVLEVVDGLRDNES